MYYSQFNKELKNYRNKRLKDLFVCETICNLFFMKTTDVRGGEPGTLFNELERVH